ncbi:MAG: S8 family serine peptidase [Halieaceae bacterium]|nr:S8 family serine peptidase [Halieaceae bacterium]
MPELRVGLIDSGLAGPSSAQVVASRGFVAGPDGDVIQTAVLEDQLGHGSALADILLQGAPGCRLLNAQVFGRELRCSAGQVAAALDWLLAQRVRLVNMSFGLREDRKVLRLACERARSAGVILVAAAPARGEPVYPASYPGVIRATGDARCTPGELSFLGTPQADFGAHVRSGARGVAGASVGCARVSARAARFLSDSPTATCLQLIDWLAGQASYRGPERRSG